MHTTSEPSPSEADAHSSTVPPVDILEIPRKALQDGTDRSPARPPPPIHHFLRSHPERHHRPHHRTPTVQHTTSQNSLSNEMKAQKPPIVVHSFLTSTSSPTPPPE
uniref:Uncharacterized protein n=1 Tax=Rhodosorus marinus TaxID=101924 RepID=A0A7S3EEZ3_9RHOD